MNNLNSLSNNNSNSGGKKGTLLPKGKFSNLVGIIIGVLALIIILFVLNQMRKAYKANKIPDKKEVVLQKYMFDCMNNQKIIDNDLMPEPVVGNEYNLTFWFYINDLNFNYQGDKNMMVKGDIVKHLEDTSKPPISVNPRIYIPGSSNSLMFEFEVDNFLDINEGCYPTTQSDFIFAPEESAADCAYIHSDDDYYALSSPLKDTIDDSLKGLCRGYSSAEIEGLTKSDSPNKCMPNISKLLENTTYYDFTDYQTRSQALITGLGKDAVTGDAAAGDVAAPATGTIAELNTIKNSADSLKTSAENLILAIKGLTTEMGKIYDGSTAPATGALVELSADIDKLKLLPEITATSIVASLEIVKKLNSLLQPMTQSLQNVNSKFTQLESDVISYNSGEGVTPITLTNIKGIITAYQTSLENLKLTVRGLLGTYQAVGTDRMQYSLDYGNADHMLVKKANVVVEQKTEIKNVPIQRWNHVSINVHNNISDIFFNGQLELSTEHKGSIKPNTFPLILGAIDTKAESGFNGFVSDIVYSNHVLTQADILGAGSIYRKGPSIVKSTGDSIKSIFSGK